MSVFFFPYLFSVSAAQHVAAHDVHEVGLGVQFTHQPAEPPPESGHMGGGDYKSQQWSGGD